MTAEQEFRCLEEECMRKSALWMAALFAVSTTACVRTATNEATGAVDVDFESPTKVGEDWSGTLAGTGMWASLKGTTRALVAEGKTSMTIYLEGAPIGSTFAWDVREGKCNGNGAVVASEWAYNNLVVDNQGKVGKTIELNARLDEAKDYAVTVYSSTINPSTGKRDVIVCGDLDD